MKKNRKIIYVIIFILVAIVLFFTINRNYIIGPVTGVVRPGLIVVEVSKTNASYSGRYYIYTKQNLKVGDIVKIRFIRVPFREVVITPTNPKDFSCKDYYVIKIQ